MTAPDTPSGTLALTRGASAAYRGYHRQLTYTLSRVLLSTESGVIFQPEGVEDLAIWRGDALVEACQVKALADPLVPSHLRGQRASFFRRASALLRDSPDLILRIVSFGPVGAQLQSAVAGDPVATEAIARELTRVDGLTLDEGRALIERIEIEIVEEAALSERLLSAASELLTGADPATSLDLLHWWLFLSAEEGRRLTHSSVVDAVVNTGRYVTSWWARNTEWFTTIEPLEPIAVDEASRVSLASEFYQGIAARPEHVAAGLDVERPKMLGAIDEALSESQVAIVRGASGQGKSTVGLRYLYGLPEPWRFRVRTVEDRAHAARIAISLLTHAKHINLPLIVWIDVSPRDAGWADLVSRLAESADVRVLVTIREEDWKRTPLPAATFKYVEVELRLEVGEARELFSSLTERGIAPEVLDFDDAWSKFGGEGPLLEFVHLVTQNTGLRDRLVEQVARLEDDARRGVLNPAELDMLRTVAVASAYEARVRVRDAAGALGLAAPRRTIERFEREYLLRTSANGDHLEGLHPIRSAILVELLTDAALSPWLDTANRVLPWIADEYLEVFLMSAFAERPGSRSGLYAAASGLLAGSWTALAGVARALLWLGVADYADRNRAVIDRLLQARGEAAWLLIDRDLAGASPSGEDLLGRIADLMPNGDAFRSTAADVRAEMTSPDAIWEPLKAWLSLKTHMPRTPAADEWSSVGEVCYWAGRLSVPLPIGDWLNADGAELDQVSVGQLADATLGLNEVGMSRVLAKYRPRLLSRFQEDTLTVRITDDGQEVRADFILPMHDEAVPTDPCARSVDRSHDETMRRVWLLRRLYPDHAYFACQGHGHRILAGAHDSTTKRIPIRNLPPDWLTSVNSTFAGYLELHVRPLTWDAVAEDVIARRKAVLDAFAAIQHALVRYHRSSDDVIIGRSLEYGVIEQALSALAPSLRLPVSVVDQWGLVTEGRRADAALPEFNSRRSLALDRYRAVVSSMRQWSQSTENFLRAAGQVLATAPLLARREMDPQARQNFEAAAKSQNIRTDLGPLSRLNLGDAVRHLREMQRDLAETLGAHLAQHSDPAFDRREFEAYVRMASLWEFFTFQPGAQNPDAVRFVTDRREEARRRFKKSIAKAHLSTSDITLRIVTDSATWCTRSAVAVVADARSDALSLLTATEEIIERLAASAREVGGDLSRGLFRLAWPIVVLVWVYDGRALDASAYRLDTEWLQTDERPNDWWRFVPAQRPRDFNESFAPPTWDAEPATEAASLVSAVADVWALAAHLADLVELGDIEGPGEGIIAQHLADTSTLQSSRLQAAIDALSALLERVSADTAGSEAAAHLVEACREIHEKILPPGFAEGEGRMRLSEIDAWRDSVADARGLAVAARLLAITAFANQPDAA